MSSSSEIEVAQAVLRALKAAMKRRRALLAENGAHRAEMERNLAELTRLQMAFTVLHRYASRADQRLLEPYLDADEGD